MLDFTVELHRTNELLERIATALERFNPPIQEEQLKLKRRGPEAIIQYGNEERAWKKEQIQIVAKERGLSPDQTKVLLERHLGGDEFDGM